MSLAQIVNVLPIPLGNRLAAKGDFGGVLMVAFNSGKRSRRWNGYVFVGYMSAYQARPFLVIYLMGKPVAVFKRSDGTLFAREMACTHDGADLTTGTIENGVVTCPRQEHRFDLDTGECVNRNYPPLKRRAVRLKGYGVYVSLTSKSNGSERGELHGLKGRFDHRLSDNF